MGSIPIPPQSCWKIMRWTVWLAVLGLSALTLADVECRRTCPDEIATRACAVVQTSELVCTVTGCALSLASCFHYVQVTIPPFEPDVCPSAVVNITLPPTSVCADCDISCTGPVLRNECTAPDYSNLACVETCDDVQCMLTASYDDHSRRNRIIIILL